MISNVAFLAQGNIKRIFDSIPSKGNGFFGGGVVKTEKDRSILVWGIECLGLSNDKIRSVGGDSLGRHSTRNRMWCESALFDHPNCHMHLFHPKSNFVFIYFVIFGGRWVPTEHKYFGPEWMSRHGFAGTIKIDRKLKFDILIVARRRDGEREKECASVFSRCRFWACCFHYSISVYI